MSSWTKGLIVSLSFGSSAIWQRGIVWCFCMGKFLSLRFVRRCSFCCMRERMHLPFFCALFRSAHWLYILYCAPVEFAVQPDCRPPARYFPGGITVNPGGLQYISRNRNKQPLSPAMSGTGLAFILPYILHLQLLLNEIFDFYLIKQLYHCRELPNGKHYLLMVNTSLPHPHPGNCLH